MSDFTPPRPRDIDPKKEAKFSKNLYNWIRRNGRHGTMLQVFSVQHQDEKRPTLYIGDRSFEGWLHGSRLMSVLCGNGKVWAHPRNFFESTVTDITEKFWTDYLRLGVCSIHESGHQFVSKKKKRMCIVCGRAQVLRVKIEKRYVWVNAPSDGTKEQSK